MSYRETIATSIESVPRHDWQRLQVDQNDAYMDCRFLAAVEQSMGVECRFWHILIYEGTEPVASASVALYLVDAAVLGQTWVKSGLAWVRRAIPGFLKFPVLFCGLPVSGGQSHLRFAPQADRAAVLERLSRILDRLAAETRALVVVFKELDTREVAACASLATLGYERRDSLPLNCFAPHFADFDDFCSNLRSHYRYKFRRSKRKFERSGLLVRHLRGQEILDCYTDDTHRLYECVVARAENRLEILPAEFFRELVRRLPEEVRFMAIFAGDRIVGFSWGLLTQTRYQNLFIGIDYEIKSQCDLYFNIMMQSLDFALKQNVESIVVGQTADVFKSRLGCFRKRLYLYVKQTDFLVRLGMRAMSGWFFPQPVELQQRRIFHDDRDDVALPPEPLSVES